jgi:hypothetical protein
VLGEFNPSARLPFRLEEAWTTWLQYGTLTVMMTIGLPDVRDLEMKASGPEDGIHRVLTNWRASDA